MNLGIDPKVEKFVSDLEAKQYKQVVSKMHSLLKDPKPTDSAKLKGYPLLRVDTGEYRIIYTHSDQIVKIMVVDKRNDDAVYKELKRNFATSH